MVWYNTRRVWYTQADSPCFFNLAFLVLVYFHFNIHDSTRLIDWQGNIFAGEIMNHPIFYTTVQGGDYGVSFPTRIREVG